MNRRDLLRALPVAAAAPLAVTVPDVRTEDYPSHPIRFVVTQGVGSGSDVVGRLLAAKLAEGLGGTVYVENRTGGGGIIGHQFVLEQPADGYTLLLSTIGPLAVVPTINRNAKFRLSNFTPVASALRSPYMVLVGTQASSPVNLKDLIQRLTTGPASYSSSGVGTLTHLASEIFLEQVRVKATHVPYKGSGQSLTDLASGQVLFSTDSPAAAGSLIRSGRLRPLAVTSDKRLASYPDVPTMAELGFPGMTLSTVGGLFGPHGIPTPIVSRISRTMASVLETPEVRKQFATMETEPLVLPVQAFADLMAKDAIVWERVATRLGIVVE